MALALIAFAIPALTCPAGCYLYNGNCACDVQPEKGIEPVQVYKPSDEKPSHHPEPAYQRGDVVAAFPESLIARDLADQRAKDKAAAQGKKKAGLKLTDEEKELLKP